MPDWGVATGAETNDNSTREGDEKSRGTDEQDPDRNTEADERCWRRRRETQLKYGRKTIEASENPSRGDETSILGMCMLPLPGGQEAEVQRKTGTAVEEGTTT